MNTPTQTTAGHTPGPWIAQKPRGRQHAIDRKWEIVHPCEGGGENVIVGEHTGIDCLTEPNALLIAAAPTMLLALQACLEIALPDAIEAAIQNKLPKMVKLLHEIDDKGRQALALARGQASPAPVADPRDVEIKRLRETLTHIRDYSDSLPAAEAIAADALNGKAVS